MKNCQFVDKFGQADRVESAESYPKLFLNKNLLLKLRFYSQNWIKSKTS